MNIMSNQERHYAYFCNRACAMFPCHPGIPEEEFNCGGNFTYTKGGIKDCSACLFPHRRASYDAIIRRYPEILELVRREPDET